MQPWSRFPAKVVGGLLIAASLTGVIGAPGQSFEEARHHWSLQPVQRPAPPTVRSGARVNTPVDAFLLEKLEAAGLGFSPPADKRTLLRRVYYDLIGLPPGFEEIQAFEQDPSPDAFAAVVDRLLASPRYGERWGRHWLDVARYADTKDLVLLYGKDALRPYAYTYRDYVIRAFNEDLPFDEFVRDQLAADRVEPALPHWRLAALGFLTLGRLFDENPHDQIDDQIDTVTRGFLGLTVACARCHDHKYDAITMQDYYGLYGVFASTERPYDLPLIENPADVVDGPAFEEKLTRAREDLEKHIETEFAKLTENFRQRIGDYLHRAATTKPDLTETTQFALSLIPEDYRPGLMIRTRRFVATRANSGDRVFAPWSELMAVSEEEDFAARSEAILESFKDPGRTATVNPLVLEALGGSSLTNKGSVASAYGRLLVAIYEESKKPAVGSPHGPLNEDQKELLDVVTGASGPIWFPRRDTPDHMSRAEKDHYNKLVLDLDKLAANATNAPPARAMVLRDLPEPYEPHVFLRGNPSRKGAATQRGFLRVLGAGESRVFESGSGRLELAREITSKDNPLTARVFVNRVWMHHFGEALVSSTTDFGTRSDPPVNGPLLDWLASEFMDSGWSVKRLHRVMVLSAAYQQAPSIQPAAPAPSEAKALATRIDPENRMLSYYPRRRVDMEAMRDAMLSVAGRLDVTLGGRPVDVGGDALNQRRTVYGLVDRQNLPAMFRAFDFAAPDQCVERRPRTTVPQQALYALNSPFVLEQARSVAGCPEVAREPEDARKIEALFRRVLGRHATSEEVKSALAFLSSAAGDPAPEGPGAVPSPLEQFAQVLLASNEFVFVE